MASDPMEVDTTTKQNGTEEEINITDDGGIKKVIIKKGEGFKKPTTGCEVTVHYVGTLLDGTKFDSSRDRSDPFVFKLGLGQVIKGWDKGVASMLKGETAILTCAPEYAYGKSGSPPKIPANATLKFEVELISWTSGETDVSETKDGGIMKKINTNGDGWETPKEEAKVKAKITGRVKDGAEFEPAHEVDFIFGEEQISSSLETAIGTMKKGEHATFTLKPKYAFGDKGDAAKGVPANAEVDYDIELIDFVKDKETWDLNTQEKLDAATKRKEEGNALFKESKFERASAKYKRALHFVDSDYGVTEEDKPKFTQMKLVLYGNIAASKLQTKDYASVKENCKKVLEIDPNNIKALNRLGKVHVELDDWVLAKEQLNRVLQLEPNNVDAKKELARLNKKIADQNAKDKKAFGGMFEKLSKMSEKEQAATKKEETKEEGGSTKA